LARLLEQLDIFVNMLREDPAFLELVALVRGFYASSNMTDMYVELVTKFIDLVEQTLVLHISLHVDPILEYLEIGFHVNCQDPIFPKEL